MYASGYDYDGNNPNGDNINEPPQNQNDNSKPELTDMHRTEVTEKNEIIPVQEQNNIQIEPNSDKETFTEDITREHDEETCEEMKEETDRPGIEHYNLCARKPHDYSHLHATMKGALQRLHYCQSYNLVIFHMYTSHWKML